MNLNRLILVATKADELTSISKFARDNKCTTIFITPDIITEAVLARQMSGAAFDIIVMADFPRGQQYGMDKFKGMNAEFFTADGYDITLNTTRSYRDIPNEIRTVCSFVRDMINPVAKISLTLNRSSRQKDNEYMHCVDACVKSRVNMLRIESNPKVQPILANLEMHKHTVDMIKKSHSIPLVVCGNVNYKIYDNLMSRSVKYAVSLDQAMRLIADIERKPDIYKEMIAKYPQTDIDNKCKYCNRLTNQADNEIDECDDPCPGSEYKIIDGLITRK